MAESTLLEPPEVPVASRRGSRLRGILSVLLIVLASLAALTGGVALYAREEITSRAAFAQRAVDAVHRPAVQQVVAREITVQLLEPALPDAVAARPAVESAIRLVIGSTPFAPAIRLAAEHGQRLLFERHGGNAVFQISDAGTVVLSSLQTLAPKFASEIPRRAEAVLLTLRRRSFAGVTLRFAETVRVLGLVLPAVALLLFAAAIAIAPDRRRAITRSAVAIGVIGIVFAIALEFARRYVIDHSYGAYELTNAEMRAAVGDLWGAYIGDLLTWTLAVTAVAWLVAAQSASLFAAYSPAAGIQRLHRFARQRLENRFRAVRGVLLLAAGIFVLVEPSLALRVIAVVSGCLIVYVGAGELLSATAPAQRPVRRFRGSARRLALSFAAVAVVIAAAIGAALAFTGARSARASVPFTCNGYAQLCSRRLDEVVFAGTHNSMSAADSPGWLIANQDRDVAQQLQDGIRAFKISTHYGVGNPAGGAHTDIAASGVRLNRVAAQLPRAARAALQRLSLSLGAQSQSNGKRQIWLCHSLCELGATNFVRFLATIANFLKLNPHQVIILFDEDYVSESDLESAFKQARMFSRLATLQSGQPLPTLGSLIHSGHNVLVFAQKHPGGHYAWDQYAFSWMQDTPLGAKKPKQFSCKLYRGSSDNPILVMNDWADVFPPRPSPNLPLVKRPFILSRSQQCERQRGKVPNIIFTDYYDRGDVAGAVNVLNGVEGQAATRTKPVAPVR